ncbi:hypothetical protein [Vibrio sp. D431a]|uniref:hypothetical protein n=1 Tax=Vibrio sp. D431a TaxID=2837388 RepID=UPI00255259CC|nr:hypothetical protein [Vibrio sp. D431a]MDK9790018.1 hypothetical protein [Vibrio sp. D431a]
MNPVLRKLVSILDMNGRLVRLTFRDVVISELQPTTASKFILNGYVKNADDDSLTKVIVFLNANTVVISANDSKAKRSTLFNLSYSTLNLSESW